MVALNKPLKNERKLLHNKLSKIDESTHIWNTQKGYSPELAAGGGYAHLKFDDTADPYQETGHNALFAGPNGQLWSSCHYFMYEKRPYPYSQTFEAWEKTPQMGIEPVYFKDGRFYIKGPSWTKQTVEY